MLFYCDHVCGLTTQLYCDATNNHLWSDTDTSELAFDFVCIVCGVSIVMQMQIELRVIAMWWHSIVRTLMYLWRSNWNCARSQYTSIDFDWLKKIHFYASSPKSGSSRWINMFDKQKQKKKKWFRFTCRPLPTNRPRKKWKKRSILESNPFISILFRFWFLDF